MRSRLLLGMVSILPAIVSAVNVRRSEDASLFSDPDWGLNAQTLPLDDLVFSPSNPIESPSLFALGESPQNLQTDTSGLLSLGENDDVSIFGPNHEDTTVDSNFQLTDCSAPGDLSPFGKSRLRPRGGFCTDPAQSSAGTAGGGGGGGMDLTTLRKLLESEPGYSETLSDALKVRGSNSLCYLFTAGILPWGMCSWGNEQDEGLTGIDPTNPIVIKGTRIFLAYTLSHATPGTSNQN